jgi:hypothetical protein
MTTAKHIPGFSQALACVGCFMAVRHSPELVRPYGRGGGGTAFDERYQAASRHLNARDILL